MTIPMLLQLSGRHTNAVCINNFFSLAVSQKEKTTKITMQLLYNQVSTSDIPMITELLKMHLPNVLYTQCFNDEGYPFSIEVQHTEIGHLFEHILLEYLCQLRIANGANKASYSGRTKWNWMRDPKGKFHIYLSCGKKDADIFDLALQKTIELMKIILVNHQTPLFYITPQSSPKNGLKNGRRSRAKKS